MTIILNYQIKKFNLMIHYRTISINQKLKFNMESMRMLKYQKQSKNLNLALKTTKLINPQ